MSKANCSGRVARDDEENLQSVGEKSGNYVLH